MVYQGGLNMELEKPAFTSTRLEEERAKDKFEVISLKLNKEERKLLNTVKQMIQQSKDGTALKQCMKIASKVLLTSWTGAYTEVLLNNKRKNQRIGIVDFE